MNRFAAAVGGGFLALLVVPLALMVLATSPSTLVAALAQPEVRSALQLSLMTSTLAVLLMGLGGTPLAWVLARQKNRWLRPLEALLELPVVLPPAVVGVALLHSFGRNGPFGGASISFTVAAVVLAQTVVAAPLYVQGATAAFRQVDEDQLLVCATLGATPWTTLTRVVLPLALPGLMSGAALAWARALGEFGATLVFAGNLPFRTQTLPLAIYSALQRDLGEAQAVSVVLLGLALGVLVTVRLIPMLGRR